MNKNDQYELSDLLNVALLLTSSNEENVGIVERINDDDSQALKQNLLEDARASIIDIGSMSNSEIKQKYKELKIQFYADKEHKKLFKQYKSNFKKAIKSDKKRTYLNQMKRSKTLCTLSVAFGVLLSIENDFVGLRPLEYIQGQDIGEYLSILIGKNVENYMNVVPEAEFLITAFSLGAILYIGGKGLVKLGDAKILRRMMVHAMSEDMTLQQAIALKNLFVTNRSKQFLWGKTSDYSVKDAVKFTPMIDYGKSLDTLEQEAISRRNLNQSNETQIIDNLNEPKVDETEIDKEKNMSTGLRACEEERII